MNKKLFMSILSLVLSLGVTICVYAGTFCKEVREVERLGAGGTSSFVESCPGRPGQRQPQAVACDYDFMGKQKVVSGCCLGGGECDNMHPCNKGQTFKCGKTGTCYPD